MSEIRQTISQLHRNLFNELVERANTVEVEESQSSLDELVDFLQNHMIAHFRDEDRGLYPAVEPLMKAHGRATAGLDMDHDFIQNYIQRITQLAQEVKTAEAAQQTQLWQRARDLFVRMEAVLEVHLSKEEALLVPLFEEYLPEDEQQRVLEKMREGHEQG
jgi:hemerythrin-like domain-containing protein